MPQENLFFSTKAVPVYLLTLFSLPWVSYKGLFSFLFWLRIIFKCHWFGPTLWEGSWRIHLKKLILDTTWMASIYYTHEDGVAWSRKKTRTLLEGRSGIDFRKRPKQGHCGGWVHRCFQSASVFMVGMQGCRNACFFPLLCFEGL